VENICHSKEYGYCLVEIDGLNVTVTWMERVGAGKYKARDVWSYTASVPSGHHRHGHMPDAMA